MANVATRAFSLAPAATGRRYLDLLTLMAERILKVRYRGSHLGVLWSLSNPLLMTVVYTLIFGAVYASEYGSIGGYVLAVFTGLAVLSFFSSATSQALGGIVSSGPLLNKIALPYSLFPIGYVAANTFQFAITSLPLLVAVTLWQTHSLTHAVAIFGPLLALLAITTGFSLILASLYVFFRDLPYLYEVFVFILYITSPIFYPAKLVPAQIRTYVALNPLAIIVEDLRRIALSPGPIAWEAVFAPMAAGAVLLGVGIAAYMLLRNEFMDLL
jgi:ABC-2 type transport system permease protein/lipopolysaccharide transport system permease protein